MVIIEYKKRKLYYKALQKVEEGFLSYFIRRYISNKALLLLFKVIGIFVIPAIKIFRIIPKLRFPNACWKYTFSEIQRFGKSYTLLWEKFKEKYDILAVRNEVTLNWFFFGSKGFLSSKKVIELKYEGFLVGYVAVKEIEHNLGKETYYSFEVVDIVVLREDTSTHYIILKSLIWLAKENGKKIIFIKISPFVKGMEDSLTKFGFFWKKGRSRFLYRKSEENNLIEDYFQQSFYATPLDGDRCYFP